MQVCKWGNSLAVRLPAVVVEALDLKAGDEIEISIAGKRDFKVARDRSKERALEQLRQMKWSFPPNFKFNREEINPRWTSENRPYVDTSKPANGAEPEQEYLYPAEGRVSKHFFVDEPGWGLY